jgi:hypothetical protein
VLRPPLSCKLVGLRARGGKPFGRQATDGGGIATMGVQRTFSSGWRVVPQHRQPSMAEPVAATATSRLDTAGSGGT